MVSTSSTSSNNNNTKTKWRRQLHTGEKDEQLGDNEPQEWTEKKEEITRKGGIVYGCWMKNPINRVCSYFIKVEWDNLKVLTTNNIALGFRLQKSSLNVSKKSMFLQNCVFSWFFDDRFRKLHTYWYINFLQF